MKNEYKIMVTKRVICTLHYMGVNYMDKDVVYFINSFVHNRLDEGLCDLDSIKFRNISHLQSNKITIVVNSEITKDFVTAYKLFGANGTKEALIDVNEYYDGIRELKTLVIDMVIHNLKATYDINSNAPNQEGHLSNMITYDIQNPFKFKAVEHTDYFEPAFLTKMYDLYDIVSTDPYSYTEKNKLTIKLKDSVVNVLNTHFSSKHRIPSYSTSRAKEVRDKLSSLKSKITELHRQVMFIIPPKLRSVDVNGKKIGKIMAVDNIGKLLKEKENVIVTDCLFFLNRPETDGYDIIFVDVNGSTAKYNKLLGTFETIGTIHVE